ncbi:TolB family protein [Thalassomonas actiniarum]|uniref:Peptidase MA-like domain-containing protein n=1 Tax=Thalassomonas actiniarum TaxID=485447 RepID=A0AAF0C2Y7_9GAMM|nr:hypothetical protein [Thalassomonas actiniarum]WDE00657.1 hypothetical protein SG35_008500 [Thalassomonas actiniarum]
MKIMPVLIFIFSVICLPVAAAVYPQSLDEAKGQQHHSSAVLSFNKPHSLSNESAGGDPLQTLTTRYGRIHYHRDYQAFAEEIARRFDAVYLDVGKLIGFNREEKLDLVIGDEIHRANGTALPMAAGSLLKLYTSAPRSEQGLGFYSDWLDLVLSHELAHKIHLAEPGRSWRSTLDPYLLEADAINAGRYPRWVAEGYATVIETEFTGQGRIHSDYVKSLLQQWALEGQLPSYGELNGSKRYLGRTMMYYQGSAFLYWLQQEYGAEKLSHLWRRATAIKHRSFEQAFTGLFLDSPENLYKQFVAEQVYLARLALGEAQPSGQLWQDNGFKVLSSEPSLDQKQILQLEQDKKGYISLSVFGLDENSKAREKFENNNRELLAKDPLDVADTRPRVFNPKALYRVKSNKKHQWRRARYLDDQHALVLQYQRQDNHELGFELAKVNLKSGQVDKLSQGLRLQDYVLSTDKSSVLAVSHFAGFNQLLKISLKDGSWQEVSEKRFNYPMDNLSLSPDGSRLALMALYEKQWHIHLYDLTKGQWQVVKLPLQGNYLSYLRWQPSGLYFSYSGKNSHADSKNNKAQGINVYRLNLENNSWQQLTRGNHISTAAFALDENRLFYLATTSEGQDTYSQDISDMNQQTDKAFAHGMFSLLPVSNPLLSASLPGEKINQRAGESEAYGPGPQVATLALGTYISDVDRGVELLARGGDPFARLRWQLAWSHGDLQQNSALKFKSTLSDIKIYAELLDNDYRGQHLRQRIKAVNGEVSRDIYLTDNSRLRLRAGLGHEKVTRPLAEFKSMHYRLQGDFSFDDAIGKFHYGFGLNALAMDYHGDGQDWQRFDYGLSTRAGYQDMHLGYAYRDHDLSGTIPGYGLLTFGGQLTSASSELAGKELLDSRFPLAWQSGFRFRQHRINMRFNSLDFFYLRHKTDQAKALSSYGLQMMTSVDNTSALLDGLNLKFSVNWFENQWHQDEDMMSLSLMYNFK